MGKSKSWQEYRDAFAFLGRMVNSSPDAPLIIELRRLFSNNEYLQDMFVVHPVYQTIASYFEEKEDVSVGDLVQELSVDWTRLFRGISPGYGPKPPYEGLYRAPDGMSLEILQAVQREYQRHGLVVSGGQHDRSDYLGFELNFMEFLCDRAAIAVENNLEEEEQTYQNAFHQFQVQHLSPWVGDFCTQAVEHARTPFYSAVLTLLKDTVSESDVAAEATPESL